MPDLADTAQGDPAGADAASTGAAAEGAVLQHRLVAFVRAFGLHRPDETPCGSPVPVSEAHALAVLADEGPLNQSDLVHHLALGKSTVSRLVDQVVARGWARRTPSPQDARCKVVELTPAGRRAADSMAGARSVRIERLMARIPPSERAAVLAALATLTEAAREA